MKLPSLMRWGSLVMAASVWALPAAQAATPAELLAGYNAQAGSPGSPERGQQFFNEARKNDLNLNCASCHGSTPTGNGRNQISEKRIPPLAPAFNPNGFTDKKKVDGWFQTNCKDVLRRDCTAQEKADVLAWLMTFKP